LALFVLYDAAVTFFPSGRNTVWRFMYVAYDTIVSKSRKECARGISQKSYCR
jgi:hypothetical protein